MTAILLVDNGSTRPAASLALRRIAAALAERVGRTVHPVSMLHSDRIPVEDLEGQPADTFAPFVRRALSEGCRDFVCVPLFFGPSEALTRFVPETAVALAEEFGAFRLRMAQELCPLPPGEDRLAAILADQVRQTARTADIQPGRVVLVDHGSPLPQVAAVRQWLARGLRARLDRGTELFEAVMERRPGAAYDFNGDRLEQVLERLATEDVHGPTILATLFVAPGRHAGPGGDIAEICARVEASHPGLRIHQTAPIGSHPMLIDVLVDRLRTAESE
jgi:sirohydrochlorin ferrochelatase